MEAAVLFGYGEPLAVTTVELAPPKEHEVVVSLRASGVCRSDLSVQSGALPFPVPCILGHEGAGVVEEVGPGVTSVRPGDHVVIAGIPRCGTCYTCERGQAHLCETALRCQHTGGLLDGTARFSKDGTELKQFMSSGTFSPVTVVPESAAVPIDRSLPFDKAALLGCGVVTGVGAALYTAPVRPGDSVVVIGCGGVGLNVVQGARIAGAERIVAVDTVASKLELARRFGATDVVDASETDPLSAVLALTPTTPTGAPRGADVVFEVAGRTDNVPTALMLTRRGGTCVLVGIPNVMAPVEIPMATPNLIASEKTLKGCLYGSTSSHRDVPTLVSLHRQGRLLLDELVSKTISLDQVNEAFADLERGEVARSVIVYD